MPVFTIIQMFGRQTGGATPCLLILFFNWRLSFVLSGNLFKLISRRIQCFPKGKKTSLTVHDLWP